MPSSVPKIRYWSRGKSEIKWSTGFKKTCKFCTVFNAWSFTFGVWMNPWCSTVNLQWAAIKHFRETGSHLKWKAAWLRTGSLWLSEALNVSQGLMIWSWAEQKKPQSRKLCGPQISTECTAAAAQTSLITVSMKPGQREDVRDNTYDSLTSTLGVGGRPLIAGFWGRERKQTIK